MLEPPEARGVGGNQLGAGGERNIAQRKQKHRVRAGSGPPGVNRLVIGALPGAAGAGGKGPALVIPHEVAFCPGLCPPPPGSGNPLCATLWEAKARSVSHRPPRAGRTQLLLPEGGSRRALGKRPLDQLLPNPPRPRGPPLRERFGGPRAGVRPLRRLGRQLRPGGLGRTPRPAGEQGQKQFAGTLGSAAHETCPPRPSFTVCSGQALG